MPTYCYQNGDDVIERHYPMGKAPDEIRSKGRKFVRSLIAEHRATTSCPGAWPLDCHALGVNVNQKAAAERAATEAGVPTEFRVTPGGMAAVPVMKDRKHYAKFLKWRGMHNRDVYYGRT